MFYDIPFFLGALFLFDCELVAKSSTQLTFLVTKSYVFLVLLYCSTDGVHAQITSQEKVCGK